MKIALDIDGVLRDFCSQLVKVYKEDYPDHEVKPINTWYFETCFPLGKDIYKYYVEQGQRIFRTAPAYDGAYDFVQTLKTLRHNVVLVTTQPRGLENPTIDWINNNLPDVDGVVFSKNKYLFDFDVLLDDAPHNIEEVTKAGKFAVFYTQKWNEHINHIRVGSYKEFLEFIIDYEEAKK